MRPWIEPVKIETPEHLLPLVGGNPIAARILMRRGYADLEAAWAFLEPEHYTSTPAKALPGVELAVERLQAAVERGEHILVWGDFDVDGQTATALLVETLRDLGAKVSHHIPVRAYESHGVNLDVLRSLLETAEHPIELLLTCDTGISAFEALEYAQAVGLDVIISDHHELPVEEAGCGAAGERWSHCLPPALSVVTPRLLPADHPLAGLPGVGVAFKLCEALYEAYGMPEAALKHLDLTALGIVADVAQQTGDTRYLLQLGLRQLRQTERVGLKAIYERAELNPENLTEEQIGFILAPRLNALGRIGDANPAVELLTTNDIGRARLLALEIEGLNAQRQLLTSQVLQAAVSQIENDRELTRKPVVILSHPAWEPGVIGIVASRLVELYGKPVVLISSLPDKPARASVRSIEGLDITAAIRACGDLLLGFGGHAMAAGFSIEVDKIPQFSSCLNREAAVCLGAAALEPRGLQVDDILEWDEIGFDLVDGLEQLSPFGAGNPSPKFVTRGLKCTSQSRFGRQAEHLKLWLEDVQGFSRQVVWWGGGEFENHAALSGGLLDLAYSLRTSSYRGQKELTVTYVDAHMSQMPGGMAPEIPVIKIMDYRNVLAPQPRLIKLLHEMPKDEFQIWIEGEAKQSMARIFQAQNIEDFSSNLRGRDQLVRCRNLIVWTTPCGRAEYQEALNMTQPNKQIIFSRVPEEDEIRVFLKRLTGFVKGLLLKQDTAALPRLASALAQREETIKIGLEWLEAVGHITLQIDPPSPAEISHRIVLIAGGTADPARAKMLLKQIQFLLEETSAYRSYFNRLEALAT